MDLRIVNGHIAKMEDFSYQVSLRRSYNDQHFCGGSLITDVHVLTAAHCMYYQGGTLQITPQLLSIFLGRATLNSTQHGYFYRNASEIFIHENFDKTTMVNDLAVIEMSKRVIPETKNRLFSISIIALNNQSDCVDWNCVVSGWGVQEFDSDVLSNALEYTEVTILNRTFCQSKFDVLNVTIYDGMLCAANYHRHTDACQGDSGGPLVCHGRLTGVISTGKKCADARFPGIYTDVRYFLPWIRNITDSYSENTTFQQMETTTLPTTSSSTSATSNLLNQTEITTNHTEITTNHTEITTNQTNLNESLIETLKNLTSLPHNRSQGGSSKRTLFYENQNGTVIYFYTVENNRAVSLECSRVALFLALIVRFLQ